MLKATALTAPVGAPADTVTLAYDDRFRRRIALTGDGGLAFLLDLPEPTDLRHGDRLALSDGRQIELRAAEEPLMRATARDALHLARLAWHIGNRHLPCEITEGALTLRRDHVIAAMLRGLGAGVSDVVAPFSPEGGAYGRGRVQGHLHEGQGHSPAPHHHHSGGQGGHSHADRAHHHAHAVGHDHGHAHHDARTDHRGSRQPDRHDGAARHDHGDHPAHSHRLDATPHAVRHHGPDNDPHPAHD